MTFQNHELEQLLKDAELLLLGGDVDDALELYNQAVEAAPEDPALYERRAELLLSMDGPQNTAQALADMERMIALGVDTVDLRYKMIVALADLGQDADARDLAVEAMAQADCYPRLCTRLRDWAVRLALRLDDLDGALAVARESRGREPESIYWAGQEARLLLRKGDDAAARDLLDEIIGAFAPAVPTPGTWEAPQWTALYCQRAQAQLSLGAFDAALADLATAEAYMADDPSLPFVRGLVAWRRGDAGAAFPLLAAGLRQAGPDLRDHFWAQLDDYPRRGALRAETGA